MPDSDSRLHPAQHRTRDHASNIAYWPRRRPFHPRTDRLMV
ncbi:hypothetical protein [Streptomyces erythrochromogenes]